MTFFEIWLNGFLLSMALLTALWLVSVKMKNASIIDPFWGFGFVVLAFYYVYATGNYSPRSILLTSLVTIWGLRLSIYLLWRNMGHGEDYRYQEFRKDYGPERYWWVSFFQVFLLQGVLMSLVALAILGTIMSDQGAALTLWDYLLVPIWLIGLSFEAGGDYQLTKFKKDKSNKGKVLNTGFWKYTRHPNYFGDTAIWWSFGLFSVISGNYYGVIGSLIMNILLLKISGVSLLEKSLKKTKPQYEDYINRTSAFFPWFPKDKIEK
jgi:steroid 5-alpha reductase family enzyme